MEHQLRWGQQAIDGNGDLTEDDVAACTLPSISAGMIGKIAGDLLRHTGPIGGEQGDVNHVPEMRIELPTVRAGDLVRAGQCSPQCLVAAGQDPNECECTCAGAFHGVLANAEVSTDRDVRPWWVRCDNCGWSDAALREVVPEVRAVKSGNEVWQRCQAAGMPYTVIRRSGRSWVFELDLAPLGFSDEKIEALWAQRHANIVDRLLHQLLSTGRMTSATLPPASYVHGSGIQDEPEARLIAGLVNDGFLGNDSTIRRALTILDNDAGC